MYQNPYYLVVRKLDPYCQLDPIVFIKMPGDELASQKAIEDAAVRWANSHDRAYIAESIHRHDIMIIPVQSAASTCTEYVRVNIRACVRVGSESFPDERTGGDSLDYSCVDVKI